MKQNTSYSLATFLFFSSIWISLLSCWQTTSISSASRIDSSWAANVLSTSFIVLLRKTNQSRYFGSYTFEILQTVITFYTRWPRVLCLFTKTNPSYTTRFRTTLFGLLLPLPSKAAGMVSFYYAQVDMSRATSMESWTKQIILSICGSITTRWR